MGKPHPIELRARTVALVTQGNTHTETARRLCVSIKFVNDMVRLERETGSFSPKPQGNYSWTMGSEVDCMILLGNREKSRTALRTKVSASATGKA